MGVRQQQKQQREWQILCTALDLFVRCGYAGTTIEQIAKAADMSTGLLFHYFASKEELYLALVKKGAEGTQAPAQREAVDPDDYFAGFLDELFAYAQQQPWVAQMFVLMAQARREGAPRAVRDAALAVDQVERSAEMIREGQRKGLFRKGDARMLSETFWASVQGVMEQWAGDPVDLAPRTPWLMGILREGAGAQSADR